jgi:hypothetical protein
VLGEQSSVARSAVERRDEASRSQWAVAHESQVRLTPRLPARQDRQLGILPKLKPSPAMANSPTMKTESPAAYIKSVIRRVICPTLERTRRPQYSRNRQSLPK